ncbi:MAG: hypothetical protein IMZ52_08565, partial [Actinobacteria bacterium]|nr:hypothetical protein [Actinomycetota bacterium]
MIKNRKIKQIQDVNIKKENADILKENAYLNKENITEKKLINQPLKITDTTLRDAHQSLLATR